MSELRESNRERMQALAMAGTPAQIGGFEEHILTTMFQMLLGPEAWEEMMTAWDEKVAKALDTVEERARFARLMAPAPNGRANQHGGR